MMVEKSTWIIYKYDEIYGYELYAYSTEKKLVKKFIEERNMKLFKIKKEKLTHEEIQDLDKETNSSYLTILIGKTKLGSHGSEVIDFELVVTKEEKVCTDNVSYNNLCSELWKHTWINPLIFNDKLIKALCINNYVNGYRMINGIHLPNSNKTYYYNDLQPDTLSCFISLYGDTLRR